MNYLRLKQVFEYGKKDAELISRMPDVNLGKFCIFLDILKCFFRYSLGSNEYKKECFWKLKSEQREEIGTKYKLNRKRQDEWLREFFENHRFLMKWSSFKYESSARMQQKRINAYSCRYNTGSGFFIGHGVIIDRHHYSDSTISIGKNCLISEQCVIDYTGGLTIENKVSISEGAKILTHNHVVDFSGKGKDKGCILTPLVIHDRVWIGTKAIIMPGVMEIGRGAMISSDAYVRTEIPPYAVVMGNPGKIIGFRMTPKEIAAFEVENYEEQDRIPIEQLEKNYDTYFLKRWKEIKEFVRLKV